MSVVLSINGREAIPVRAIPYVTGWDVSPDMVAQSLANSSDGWRLDRLTAYQYHANDSHTPILPKEWDGIEDRLRGLSASLDAKHSNRDIARPQWLKESVLILPAGVYVWRDELEKSWHRFSERTIIRKGERPNDGLLNFSPMIPDTLLREEVCKGFPFQQVVTESAPQAPPPPISDRQALLRRRKSITIAEAAERLTGIAGWTKENRAAMDLIREAIQNGELEPVSVHYWNEHAWTFDASRAVIDQNATTVTAANFEAWRARTFPSTGTPAQVPDEAQEQTGTACSGAPEVAPEGMPDDWRVYARIIADECFDRDTRNNSRDSLAGYSRRVMDLMQKREIHGPRGRIDNANTIQREALQGSLWWAPKKK